MKPDLCFYPRRFTFDEAKKNIDKLSEIFQRNEVSLAFLLGSICYGSTSNDLDVGVFFKEKKRSSIDLYSDLYFDLCSIFKADNIDVVILNDTGPAFRFEVISKGVPIYYPAPEELTSFCEMTLFQYEDTHRFRKESHRELTASIREGLMKERRIHIQRVDTFLKTLKESIGDIRRLIEPIRNIDEFLSPEKKDTRNLTLHYLRIALESVLDVSRHIIAVKGFGIADLETENLIDILGKNDVIPYGFSKKIRGMAGMRNAIVHAYWNLDYEKIFDTAKNRLIDFEDFARYIMEYVEKKNRQ
jgi:uncharacterized protein YutE (UPF0331/DUF86 family)/predicted nucleotidyltransferase